MIAHLLLGCSAVVTSAASKPNLLLLFPDEWRWDYAGFDPEEADLRLPNIQALAERGTRFTSAYTPSPWCAPARGCLASVQFFDGSPQVLNGRSFPLTTPTWFQALREAGYHTITAGKDDLTQSFQGMGLNGARHAEELGFDDWFRMQDKYVTYRRRPWDQFGAGTWNLPCGLTESGKSNLYLCNDWCYGLFGRGKCCTKFAHEGFDCAGFDQVGADQENYVDNYIGFQAEMLLDRAPTDKPWVMQLSFPGPHPPFVITEAMNASMAGRSFAPARDNQQNPADQQRRIRARYAAEIENIDAVIGSLLAKIESRGEAGNTLIVVTSDHGEQLGDQNAWGKKMPWEPSIRVPLVVCGPDVAANRTVTMPVSTLDVIGTFLERAGTNMTGQEAVSLDPLLQDGPADPEAYLKDRPFVFSGLTYPGGLLEDGPVDFRVIIRHINDTHTMKVVCCPYGCPAGNSYVPTTAPHPQLMAFNVAGKPPLDVENLNWTSEALELARYLPGEYATACLPAGYTPRPRPSWPLSSDVSLGPSVMSAASVAAPAVVASDAAAAEVEVGAEEQAANQGRIVVTWHADDHADGQVFDSFADAQHRYDELSGGAVAVRMYDENLNVLHEYGTMGDTMGESEWAQLDDFARAQYQPVEAASLPGTSSVGFTKFAVVGCSVLGIIAWVLVGQSHRLAQGYKDLSETECSSSEAEETS